MNEKDKIFVKVENFPYEAYADTYVSSFMEQTKRFVMEHIDKLMGDTPQETYENIRLFTENAVNQYGIEMGKYIIGEALAITAAKMLTSKPALDIAAIYAGYKLLKAAKDKFDEKVDEKTFGKKVLERDKRIIDQQLRAMKKDPSLALQHSNLIDYRLNRPQQ